MNDRIEQARAALAADRAADAAVDKVLKDLAQLDEDATERVLSRLVALLQGAPPQQRPQIKAVPKESSAESFADLPSSVRKGAEAFKKGSGLPEKAVCQKVMGWVSTCGETAVAEAFTAMMEERPSHELAFLQQMLNAA